MHDEMESLEKNGILEFVELSKKKKDIWCNWIFKSCETRLVAKGYSQIPGIDCTEVFSPIVKHSSIRTLLSIVVVHDYELKQLDVKCFYTENEKKAVLWNDRKALSFLERKPGMQIEDTTSNNPQGNGTKDLTPL